MDELFRFQADWFDGVAWAWKKAEIIAHSEAEARKLVDRDCPPQYRHYPDYVRPRGDSLLVELSDERPLTVPFFLEVTYHGRG